MKDEDGWDLPQLAEITCCSLEHNFFGWTNFGAHCDSWNISWNRHKLTYCFFGFQVGCLQQIFVWVSEVAAFLGDLWAKQRVSQVSRATRRNILTFSDVWVRLLPAFPSTSCVFDEFYCVSILVHFTVFTLLTCICSHCFFFFFFTCFPLSCLGFNCSLATSYHLGLVQIQLCHLRWTMIADYLRSSSCWYLDKGPARSRDDRFAQSGKTESMWLSYFALIRPAGHSWYVMFCNVGSIAFCQVLLLC